MQPDERPAERCVQICAVEFGGNVAAGAGRVLDERGGEGGGVVDDDTVRQDLLVAVEELDESAFQRPGGQRTAVIMRR